MEIVKIPLSQIRPYHRNARINDKTIELVKKSIEKYGYNVPIQLDKDYVIIAGHARYKALLELDWKEAFCIIKSDLTPEQVKEYRIIDNKTQEATEWDEEQLYIELRELDPVVLQPFFLNINLQEINAGQMTSLKGVTQ